MSRKVYVNRTLNLKRINYIGLDMDHTLVRYNSHNFELAAHEIVLKKLVEDLGYPREVLKIKFEFNRSIRGLVVDKNLGNILKLSRHGAIRGSSHGLKDIDFNTQKKLYKSTYIDLSDPGYDTVDTTFSIAFCGLFAQLVELKDTALSKLPEYNRIADDLIRCLDRAHRDGSLKSAVAKNIDQFIVKDESVVRGLERYIKHGKKIFIVTNSDFHYTKLLLDYAINPFLKDHESWVDLFEVVITSAQKPRFFYDNLRFLKVNPKDGSMTNLEGKVTKGVYQGGCATSFTDDLGVAADEILYIGDHIYGDIVRLKKDCAWRTALVVEELEDEIINLKRAEPIAEQINKLMKEKIPLEVQIDDLVSEKIEQGRSEDDSRISELIKKVGELDKKIGPLIKEQQKLFNPYWGEVMKVGIEDSYFAYQVERFACVYMSKLSDLLELSPRTYFRSVRRPQAHELMIESPWGW